MNRTAQLLVTLSPQGGLQVELPGANGSRRKVELAQDPVRAVSQMLGMLLAQQAGAEGKIGSSANPTQWQVDRWTSVRKALEGLDQDDPVVVRYSTPRAGAQAVALPDSAEDIGL